MVVAGKPRLRRGEIATFTVVGLFDARLDRGNRGLNFRHSGFFAGNQKQSGPETVAHDKVGVLNEDSVYFGKRIVKIALK